VGKPERLVIAGAGIAGLTCSLALARTGRIPQVLDQAPNASEEGAGLQLGPNVTRYLQSLGLLEAILPIASRPQAIRIRQLRSHKTLSRMELGATFEKRYGNAPYLTLHRADLMASLLRANAALGIRPQWGTRVEHIRQTEREVQVRTQSGHVLRADGLIGADGIFSRCRLAVPNALANPPRPVGQIAFRGLIQDTGPLDPVLAREVTVWTRPGLHLVGYPIRAGKAYNLVALCPLSGDWKVASQGWSQPMPEALLQNFRAQTCGLVQELLTMASPWHAWAMQANQALAGPESMWLNRVFLMGDAAHPLRPHLAQGAGMGIEDAVCLSQALAVSLETPLQARFADAAKRRWTRNALVQKASERNGRLFQMRPPWVWGRDLALRLFGSRLMDQPWLYNPV